MRVLLRTLGFGLTMFVAVAGAGAQAQPAANASVKAKAKAYVDRGLAEQNDGHYDMAITLYAKAYDLLPHPLLLFDIAQAHRLAGHSDEAIAYYEKYLAIEPNGAQAATARDLLAELKADRGDTAAPTDVAPPTMAPTNTVVSTEGTVSRVDTERAWRSWGLVAGGAGAVSLVLAIGYGLHAETLSDHVSRRYDSKLASEGETANQVAVGGWITGGVLVTAGAVMYWYGSTHAGRADRVTLAPTISERGAGLVIAGAFR